MTFRNSPDPFAPLYDQLELCGPSLWLGSPYDVWGAPEDDGRSAPGDVLAPEWRLPALKQPPRPKYPREVREQSRFRVVRVTENRNVWELVRLTFTRPGYLTRLATFLEVKAPGGAVVYISNDLSDPDPFPLAAGDDLVTVRWHLIFDETIGRVGDPPFIVAASREEIPSAHQVDDLMCWWEDMRYHWGQRPANKLARVRRPGHVRLFAEVLPPLPAASVAFRFGGLLGGWQGT